MGQFNLTLPLGFCSYDSSYFSVPDDFHETTFPPQPILPALAWGRLGGSHGPVYHLSPLATSPVRSHIAPRSDEIGNLEFLIHNVYAVVAIKPDLSARMRRLKHLLASLDDRVALLQETQMPPAKKAIRESSGNYWIQHDKGGKVVDSGLSTVVPKPWEIIFTDFKPFSKTQGVATLGNMGASLVVFNHPRFGRVGVYNVHLQTSFDLNFPSRNSEIRRWQIQKDLKEFIAAHHDQHDMYFVGGDFNAVDGSEEIRILTQEWGLIDLLANINTQRYAGTRDLNTYRQDNRYFPDHYKHISVRYDYLFYDPQNSGWKVQADQSDFQIEDLQISDHAPIIADITLVRSVPPVQENNQIATIGE